jgi:hypothetical protein
MAIIVTKQGKNAIKIDPSRFEQENDLQEYIAQNPDSLPLYEIKEDIRLLILGREFPTNSGPIDAIGIDKDGEIYIVETKLYKNPDKRLVVAQVLDYGASLWRTEDSRSFVQQLDEVARSSFGSSLNEKLTEFFGLDSNQCDQVASNLEKNHRDGAFHFVVLMDKLHDRLRDLIVFLNQNSRFDIYAVEIEYYKFDQYEVVIPKLFGSEVKKEAGISNSSGKRRKWDEASFFEDAAQKLGKLDLESVKKLYEVAKKLGANIYWGSGFLKGSFNPIFEELCPRSPFSVYSNGVLALSFGWISGSEGAEKFRISFRNAIQEKLKFPMNPAKEYIYLDPEIWTPQVDGFIELLHEQLALYS